jgi:uncharacterized caspase-like protein
VAVLLGLLSTGLVSFGVVRAARPVIGSAPVTEPNPAKKSTVVRADRIALVIGNSKYPDAPLPDVTNDADALADALRKKDFLVDTVHDATQVEMRDAFDRLRARGHPGAVVLVYFGGFGVQSRGENYVMPVDAKIWTEASRAAVRTYVREIAVAA